MSLPPKVIFNHVPKTAGQALHTWLRSEFGDEACGGFFMHTAHTELIEEWGTKSQFLNAHIVFADGEPMHPDWAYVTCLREPADRALCWLSYCMTAIPIIGEHTIALRKGAIQFYESKGASTNLEFLASIQDFYVRQFPDISKYAVVGVYENFPKYLADVAALVGLSAPTSIPVVNHHEMVVMSDTIRARVAELVAADTVFYNNVVAAQMEVV